MKTLCTLNDQECRVSVISGDVILKGNLGVPTGARGIVLFAHGSGSSRHCPQNRYLAQVLRQARIATLLLDLLTQAEEASHQDSPDGIDLFAERLVGATDWLLQNPLTQNLSLGYFGTNTGASAALIAAAECPEAISAVVSRSGWLDRAGEIVSRIEAPTLLIVGGNEAQAIAENRSALGQLKAEKQLEIVRGATHSFAEPGALERVAWLASQWFDRHLVGSQVLDFC
jgi:dienelactone hydrolase